ncbi:MAG: dihydrolipoamide acetyltransferase family protein [Alphaproteobacteria bacterium]
MPSLGADMEAGKLVEWLKHVGDPVASGDIVAVVETQKGAIEIEVFESGTLDQVLVQVGATVPVGTPLAVIRGAGEAPGAAVPVAAPPAVPPRVTPAPVAKRPAAAPPAMRVAPAPAGAAPIASPAARRFAAEHGIDLAGVRGSGPEGAVVFVDVETAWRTGAVKPAAPDAAAKPSTPGANFSAMRAAIAAAMARSKREIPHYYIQHSVDVTDAQAWLTRRNEARPPSERVLFAAVLIKALAASLAKFPEFNGHYLDNRFAAGAKIHVGMAIALRGGGLIAPAIHDAGALSLDAAMAKLLDLVNRVRAGRFRSSEIADPTITLTSLGERGSDSLLPVIYPPQVAIIGAGTPALRPWIVDGAVKARQVLQLSLAADHRVSDGHRGALLLAELAAQLQQPDRL